MLYALNLHSAVCQLYLKTGRKKNKERLLCHPFLRALGRIWLGQVSAPQHTDTWGRIILLLSDVQCTVENLAATLASTY